MEQVVVWGASGHAQVGMGTVVKEKLRLGARSVIGAGSLVTSGLPADCLTYSAPATLRSSLAGMDPLPDPERQHD